MSKYYKTTDLMFDQKVDIEPILNGLTIMGEDYSFDVKSEISSYLVKATSFYGTPQLKLYRVADGKASMLFISALVSPVDYVRELHKKFVNSQLQIDPGLEFFMYRLIQEIQTNELYTILSDASTIRYELDNDSPRSTVSTEFIVNDSEDDPTVELQVTKVVTTTVKSLKFKDHHAQDVQEFYRKAVGD